MKDLYITVYSKPNTFMVSYILFNDEAQIMKSAECYAVSNNALEACDFIINQLRPNYYRIKHNEKIIKELRP